MRATCPACHADVAAGATRCPSCGARLPAAGSGAIEEIPLQDASASLAISWFDRALVVLAVVAVGSGLLIAGANALGFMGKTSTATRQSASAAASASQPTPTTVPPTIAWQETAEIHRFDIGDVFRYSCPAGGTPAAIFGLGVYADTSSVCSAAVHWGELTLSGGGTVTIMMQAGAPSYTPAEANGVTSAGLTNAIGASFVFVQENEQSGPWSRGAVVYRRFIGKTFDYECPPNGTPSLIWGSGRYTDDSSVCTAAVHSGLITFDRGGTVTIKIRRGIRGYVGSVQNHVVSSSWAVSSGSFVFVQGPDSTQQTGP
jgi:hypothetical protein